MGFASAKQWFGAIKCGLTKTSSRLRTGIRDIFKDRIDPSTLDALEELLISADIGVLATKKLVASIAKMKLDRGGEEGAAAVFSALRQGIVEILAPYAVPLDFTKMHFSHTGGPTVIMLCGVNGNGKTTTVAKLAQQGRDAGLKVMVAACDTFRAAATEQLTTWAERIDVPCVTGKHGADPASVAYQALERAESEKTDLLLIDTAGRLHNQQNLMEELAKIANVLKKRDPTAPHHRLLVLDATTGQNATHQLEMFQKTVGITGLIVTKLDGSARGGVVIGLAQQFKLPIHAIGVGEKAEDLRGFNADAFADALLADAPSTT